jgi:ABC-type uncharacterized transport system permease subunit
MTWSMVLIYLVVGSPVAFVNGGFYCAGSVPIAFRNIFFAGQCSGQKIKVNLGWKRTSFSMVACGAFALACIAGVMYLIQEQQLKTRQPSSIFFRLPPITALSVANSRLLWLGFALFTVGLTTGFLIGHRIDWIQAAWAIAVWCIYGGILVARVRRALAAKWVATLSIIAFSLLLSTFLGFDLSQTVHRFK